MNKTLHLSVIICLILGISSCDPGQELIFVNKSDADLSLVIVESGNSIQSVKNNVGKEDHASGKDTTILHLKNGQKNNADTIRFGLGTWEINNRLDSFLCHLKEVSFIKNNDTVIFKGKLQLDSLFRNNMKGKYKESIVIEIE
jgi:hypothetical protein